MLGQVGVPLRSRSRVALEAGSAMRFACVGAVGLVVNSACLWLLTEWGHMYYLLSSAIATEVAIVCNFVLNQVWTFAALSHGQRRLVRLAKFNATALIGLGITVGMLYLITRLTGLHYLVANILAVGFAATWNYGSSRRWIWPDLHLSVDRGVPSTARAASLTVGNGGASRAVEWIRRALVAAFILIGLSTLVRMFPPLDPVAGLVLVLSLTMTAQSLFSLYLMLYAWEHPERLQATRGPESFRPPELSFTVLLPARHEEAVIFETIRCVVTADYPSRLLEVVVVCHRDDEATIREARRAVNEFELANVRVVSFTDGPINKPRGLNVGFRRTSHAVVAVFDAEDDIHPDIFNVVNTTMLGDGVNVVQAGVQLMNFRDHWFAVHNVLEYFFWFKSRLHYHARVGMIPLGGNTVFMRRELLERIGGWDETCLTEDAEIGLRLSALGERIRVVYDPQRVTREETPDSTGSLVRQRTRWHQGFVQVLRRGTWLSLPTLGQKLLAVYTLSYPLFQAILMLAWPFMLAAVFVLKVSVPAAMMSFLPLYALGLQFLATAVGAYVFTREYGLRFPIWLPLAMAITFLPYQWLLGISAVRAVYRELRNRGNWEKTSHVGAHRRVQNLQAGLVTVSQEID